MKRSELAIIVTVIDIFCVIIFILGYYFLAKNSEAALMEYKELKVDMKELRVSSYFQKFTVQNKVTQRRIVKFDDLNFLQTFPNGYFKK